MSRNDFIGRRFISISIKYTYITVYENSTAGRLSNYWHRYYISELSSHSGFYNDLEKSDTLKPCQGIRVNIEKKCFQTNSIPLV